MPVSLHPGVTVFHSGVAVDMASVVLERDGAAVLVDPGILPDEVERIADHLVDRRLRVDGIVLTHAHWDHIGATGRWAEAPVITHRAFPEWLTMVEGEEPLAEARSRTWQSAGLPPPDFAPLPRPSRLVGEGDRVGIGAGSAAVLDLPGHLGGAMGLHLEDLGIVVCGDILDSVELPLPLQDVDAYLASLARLCALLDAGAEHVIPGHGPPLSRAAALAQVAQDQAYVLAVIAVAEDAVARGWPFEAAWPHFAALPYFGKGTAARDEEHRINAREILAMRLGLDRGLPDAVGGG